jgi:hypothetical protein
MTEILDGQPGRLGIAVGFVGDSHEVVTQRAE